MEPQTSRRRTVRQWSEHEKLSYEKELLGFYVSGHPLDAYVGLFAGKNYQMIASLGELADRATFKIAGALVQIDKKFTRKEGKPFAVVWIEDLTGTLEVVVWNDVYVQISDPLIAGRVVEVRGTIDTRGDSLRATAQKIRLLAPDKTNGVANGNGRSTSAEEGQSAVLLQFSPATTSDDLREVREILASSPGQRPVQLLFDRSPNGPLWLEAGEDFRVDLTAELEQRLSRWLVTAKLES
jgi:DNA polymerase-3 subunit alpha